MYLINDVGMQPYQWSGNLAQSLFLRNSYMMKSRFNKKSDNSMEQSGSGILDKASSVYQKLKQVPSFVQKAVDVYSSPTGIQVADKVSQLISNNPNARKGFAGEKHAFLNTSYGLTKANYAGPGTHLQERLARGDPPISQIDAAAKQHDIDYSNARNKDDVRKADNDFIKKVKKANDTNQLEKNIVIAAIKAKKLGEDVGVFDVQKFTELKNLKGGYILPLYGRIKPSTKQILKSQARRGKKGKVSFEKRYSKRKDISGEGFTIGSRGYIGTGKKRKGKFMKENISYPKAKRQKGGELGFILSTLAPLIIPEVIKGAQKLFKKKK